MNKLIAFHGKISIKNKYIERVKTHQKLDEIIHGTYVKKYGKEANQLKGCAVGCTIHSKDHAAYETELGIPRVLACLEDGIFEGLSPPHDTEWPLQFLEAIPVGADLSNVWPQFAVWMLIDKQWGVLQFAKTAKTKTAIKVVAEFYKSGKYAKPEYYDEIRKIRAASYASDAAYAAYDAAAAAADASDATYAAYDAAAAAAAASYADAAASYADAAAASDASYAAAYAAAAYDAYDADAAAASRKKWRKAQADKLLELLREAPELIEVRTE